MLRLNSKNRGFTLVEVMVVVTIIGILAASLMPQLSGFTDKARVARASSEINGIKMALLAYLNDNLDTYPGGNIRHAEDAPWLNAYLAPAGRAKRYLDKQIGADPWGTAYRFFSCNDYVNGHSFIMSRGLNKSCSGGLNWATAPNGDDLVTWVR